MAAMAAPAPSEPFAMDTFGSCYSAGRQRTESTVSSVSSIGGFSTYSLPDRTSQSAPSSHHAWSVVDASEYHRLRSRSFSVWSGNEADADGGYAGSSCGETDISAEDEVELVAHANNLGLLNFLGDDSTEQVGDETVRPEDERPTPNTTPFRVRLPGQLNATTVRREPVQQYDKGNVTVVSGGIRLGAAAAASSGRAEPRATSAQTSKQVKSGAEAQSARGAAPAKAGPPPRIPMLPLPPALQQTQVRTTSGFYRATAAAFSSSSDTGGESDGGEGDDWDSAQLQLEKQGTTKQRTRPRGRRSRGRGAGRALRRQQAAIVRALAAAEGTAVQQVGPEVVPSNGPVHHPPVHFAHQPQMPPFASHPHQHHHRQQHWQMMQHQHQQQPYYQQQPPFFQHVHPLPQQSNPLQPVQLQTLL